ncbi:MAG: ribosome small subunit-dependent GTPase A [Planctomycetota bacterium]
MSNLSDLGLTEELRQRLLALEPSEPGLEPARIATQSRTRLTALGEGGPIAVPITPQLLSRAEAALGGPLVVGDWVGLRPADGAHDREVACIAPRRSALVRKAAGGRSEQVIGANLDTVFVVTSANQDLSPRRIERYLALVWESGASPVVVLNKVDLIESADELEALVGQLTEVALGVPVVTASAHLGDGLSDLLEHLGASRTGCLVGSSGVGKSSLTNALLGREVLATAAVRSGDAKGRHTTTHRELFLIEGGGVLIDTPGMRELALTAAAEVGVREVFRDLEDIAAGCRFRDCAHDAEPGCALQAALEDGTIDRGRLKSYVKLLREVAREETKALGKQQRVAAAQAKQRYWKQITKAYRKRKIKKRN